MIKAVFFDIGGTVHTQDATPESDRDYKERLWRYLEEHGIRTADTPDELLEHINKGAKAYKAYTEEELIEIPADRICMASSRLDTPNQVAPASRRVRAVCPAPWP